VAEIVERFSDVEFTCEYKYDGERAQVHVLENGDVRVFSRNLEDNTTKYPDIVHTFKAHLKPGVRSVVLDAEAVAYDREAHKILPFQVLSTRAKKGVAAEDVKIQARLHAPHARMHHMYCARACAPSTPQCAHAAHACVWPGAHLFVRAPQVCLFAFDCLFADGRTLLREPLSERRRLLYGCLNETEGHLQFAKERTRCVLRAAPACIARAPSG
jgi:DNA ligase-1